MWNKIYSLILENKNCAALDIMFYEIDSLCLAGKFSDVDVLIKTVDLKQLNTTLMIGLLCITKCATLELLERENSVKLIEQRLNITEPNRVEKLIGRLK
jgi:hypothetical protein